MVAPPHSLLFRLSRLTPMRIAFKPPLWSILPTVLVTALFVTLGAWQLGRAHQKEALQAAFDTASTAPVTSLPLQAPRGACSGSDVTGAVLAVSKAACSASF